MTATQLVRFEQHQRHTAYSSNILKGKGYLAKYENSIQIKSTQKGLKKSLLFKRDISQDGGDICSLRFQKELISASNIIEHTGVQLLITDFRIIFLSGKRDAQYLSLDATNMAQYILHAFTYLTSTSKVGMLCYKCTLHC